MIKENKKIHKNLEILKIVIKEDNRLKNVSFKDGNFVYDNEFKKVMFFGDEILGSEAIVWIGEDPHIQLVGNVFYSNKDVSVIKQICNISGFKFFNVRGKNERV